MARWVGGRLGGMGWGRVGSGVVGWGGVGWACRQVWWAVAGAQGAGWGGPVLSARVVLWTGRCGDSEQCAWVGCVGWAARLGRWVDGMTAMRQITTPRSQGMAPAFPGFTTGRHTPLLSRTLPSPTEKKHGGCIHPPRGWVYTKTQGKAGVYTHRTGFTPTQPCVHPASRGWVYTEKTALYRGTGVYTHPTLCTPTQAGASIHPLGDRRCFCGPDRKHL